MPGTLDGLLELARAASANKFAHAQIEINPFGTTIVLHDAEPREMQDFDGGPVTVYRGQIIAAGSGVDLDDAIGKTETALGGHGVTR